MDWQEYTQQKNARRKTKSKTSNARSVQVVDADSWMILLVRTFSIQSCHCPEPKFLCRVIRRVTGSPIIWKADMDEIERINFYSVSDEYGCFSNFAPYSIELKGKRWPTSEHYFQAQKFKYQEHQAQIRKANSPMIAARLGRDRKKKLRRDWESVKDNVMREAVLAKFTQHEELREILMGTGDAKLVEHTSNDSYWGDGGDGSGRNMLGTILMEVRVKVRNPTMKKARKKK